MKYFIIGDEDSVLGFSMAGVDGIAVADALSADKAFSEALSDKENGIILITERIAELIRDKVDRYIFTVKFPLIVEIPDRFGSVEGRGDLRKMVNEAIGIKLQ
jgi:V/A-type H+-transporting ATPase subunit F